MEISGLRNKLFTRYSSRQSGINPLATLSMAQYLALQMCDTIRRLYLALSFMCCYFSRSSMYSQVMQRQV